MQNLRLIKLRVLKLENKALLIKDIIYINTRLKKEYTIKLLISNKSKNK